jgi:hypothetical protein
LMIKTLGEDYFVSLLLLCYWSPPFSFYQPLIYLPLWNIYANSFSVSCICLLLLMWRKREQASNEIIESKKSPFEETPGPSNGRLFY